MKRFFSCMSSYMFSIVFFGKEIFFTMFALMGFDLKMYSFSMVDQGGIGFESWTTGWTQKWFCVFMNRNFVNPQGGTSCKAFWTMWAGVRSFSYKWNFSLKAAISQFSKIRQIKVPRIREFTFYKNKKKYTKSMVFEFCPHKPLILQFKYNHASRATSPKHTFFPILENSGCIFSFSTGCLHF